MKKQTLEQSIMEVSKSQTITIKDNSQASIVIRPVTPTTREELQESRERGITVKLKIGKNCRVETYIIQDKSADIIQSSSIGENSILRANSIWLSEGNGHVDNILEGIGAQAYSNTVFVCDGSKKLNFRSNLTHANRNTCGKMMIKGVVGGTATARLDGKIIIGKKGAGSDSFLTEKVILLNPGAHAIANPELEIENNDVSSKHAASVSQIDEDKIFYLMSRGLTRSEAKTLIVEGFLGSVLDAMDTKNDQQNTKVMGEIRKTILNRV